MGVVAAVDRLPVAEVFRSVQGEGPFAGRACSFVRLSGCNLSCSWCDTPETWDARRFRLADYRQLLTVDRVLAELDPGLPVVVTGGEPLLYQDRPAWGELLGVCSGRGVWLETNGTIDPTDSTLDSCECMVVSPKLSNAGPHRGRQSPYLADRWRVVAGVVDRVHLKFVCEGAADVDAVAGWAAVEGWPRSRVWVMPEGVDADTLAERWPVVADAAVAHGLNVSHRLHILAWGNTRGT